MKKIFLALALLTGVSANAQTASTETPATTASSSGLFIDFGIGSRFGGITTESTIMQVGLNLDGGIGYMFNNIFGVRGNMSFNTFKAVDVNNEAVSDRGGNLQMSLQGVVSISEAVNFGTPGFGLNFHTGFGFGTIFNPDFKAEYVETHGEFLDPMIKGNDDVVNYVFGLSPRFPINDKICVTLDVSHLILFKQDNYYDRRYSNAQLENTNQGITTTTVGISINL